MRKLVAGALLAFTSVAFAAESMALKGLHPGQTLDEVKALHPVLHCDSSEACSLDTTTIPTKTELDELGGFHVRQWDLRFDGGKLGSITAIYFKNHSDELAKALTEKFGKPRDVPVALTNGFGAKFTEHYLEWSRGANSISLLASPLESRVSILGLTSKAWRDRAAAADRAAAKARAKDF